jgi:hypothetical protein
MLKMNGLDVNSAESVVDEHLINDAPGHEDTLRAVN